jgi:hypothetical protein
VIRTHEVFVTAICERLSQSLLYIYVQFGLSVEMPCIAMAVILLAHISYAYVVLNPAHCEAAGMMESGGSFLYASCGGGFLQPMTV